MAHPATPSRWVLTATLACALAVIAGASAAAVDVAVDRYQAAARAGAVGSLTGRAYAERRTPDGTDLPFAGAEVKAVPWSETLARRLHELREGARRSAPAYRDAATLMQTAQEGYERELGTAGAGDLIRSTVVSSTGRFDLGPLPEGRWMLVAMSEVHHGVTASRSGHKDRELYAPTPRLVGFKTRLLWLRDVAVAPRETTQLELTDRNIWFTGVVEERRVDPAPRRR
jgi:hypothetical protein